MIDLLFLALTASTPPASNILEVDVDGLRNSRGLLQGCVTANRRSFPDCRQDPGAVKISVAAGTRRLVFSGFAPGDYAVTLFHDANANGKLDTLVGVPLEGFGFSRSPVVRFGPPRYDDVNIRLGSGFSRITVRLQYIL